MPTFMIGIRLLVYPSSVIKTRLQTSTQYTGTTNAFFSILRQEGLAALYKGFTTSLATMAIGPIYVSMLEGSRSEFQKFLNPVYSSLLAGGLSSCLAQTLAVPIDIVTQQQQVQKSVGKDNLSALQIIAKVYGNEGLRGFYKGYFAALMQYVPHSAILWGSYAFFKKLSYNLLSFDFFGRDRIVVGIAGALAGLSSALLTMPFDVIRTRMQVTVDPVTSKPYNFKSTVNILYKTEGWRGFYIGLSPRLMTLIPTTFLLMLAFETAKNLSKREIEEL